MIHGRTPDFALHSNQTTIYFVSNLDSSKALHWRVFKRTCSAIREERKNSIVSKIYVSGLKIEILKKSHFVFANKPAILGLRSKVPSTPSGEPSGTEFPVNASEVRTLEVSHSSAV